MGIIAMMKKEQEEAKKKPIRSNRPGAQPSEKPAQPVSSIPLVTKTKIFPTIKKPSMVYTADYKLTREGVIWFYYKNTKPRYILEVLEVMRSCVSDIGYIEAMHEKALNERMDSLLIMAMEKVTKSNKVSVTTILDEVESKVIDMAIMLTNDIHKYDRHADKHALKKRGEKT